MLNSEIPGLQNMSGIVSPTVDSLDMLDYLPKHISCFIHTLQLVVHDGIKQIGGCIVDNKVSKMVSFVRHSCQATSLFEGGRKLQKKMTQDGTVQIRCSNHFWMHSAKLTKYEMKVISEITAVLTLFGLATMQCQAQKFENCPESLLVCILQLMSKTLGLSQSVSCSCKVLNIWAAWFRSIVWQFDHDILVSVVH